MDRNNDKFIKDFFKEDTLISKKADDIFNKFITGDIDDLLNEGKEEVVNNVIDINEEKSKREKKDKEKVKKHNGARRFLSAVASVAIVFVAVNAYASTQGYENIFFMIKDLIYGEVVIEDKEEILSDRDITISYESIDVNSGLEIQINRLVIEENKAVLSVYIEEESNTTIRPNTYKVYDITDGDKVLLTTYESLSITDDLLSKYPGSTYTEEITLDNFKNSTKVLELEVYDDSKDVLIDLKIDIENKQINVVSKKEIPFEKISEVELKDVMSSYVALNYFKDTEYRYWYGTKVQADNRVLVELAMHTIYEKYPNYNTNELGQHPGDINKVNVALKELTGKEYSEPLDLVLDDFLKYNKEKDIYEFDNGDGFIVPALCLDISDISFRNGIYYVTCVYCFPGDYFENSEIANLAQYKTTFELKINEKYDYFKYKIVNFDNLTSVEIKKAENKNDDELVNNTVNEISNTITTNTISNTISNTVTNSVNNNIEEDYSGITYVDGKEYDRKLVDFFKYIVRINFHKDLGSISNFTKAEYENEHKILAALEIVDKISITYEEQGRILWELIGRTEYPLKSSHIIVGDWGEGRYFYIGDKNSHHARPVIEQIFIKSQDEQKCVAEVVYRQKQEDSEKFVVTIEYTQNPNYIYSKYKCLNVDNLNSSPYNSVSSVSTETTEIIVENLSKTPDSSVKN